MTVSPHKAEVDRQLEIIRTRTEELIPAAEWLAKLERSIATKTPLRVKQGFDPTAPDIHLGHTLGLRKLRQFQELGHQVVLIVGSYTALVGDPSGRSATRPPLTEDQVMANAQTYMEQFFKVVDRDRTEVHWNGDWFKKMSFVDILKLASQVTVARILERDDFEKRYNASQPISLHEFFYPLMQGFDSVAIKADIEVGGTDQKFNLLMGRNLQREYAQESQIAVITPLLEGTDGVQKMSKSLGNYIGINEPPQEIFGKVMSISDELMWRYHELCTDLSVSQITSLRESTKNGERNPRDVKADLAKRIVADFYSHGEAHKAEDEFNAMFRNKQAPDSVEEKALPSGMWKLPKLLVELGMVSSMAEARRMIEQGGVYVEGERRTQSDFEVDLSNDHSLLIQVGKRRFVRVKGE